jgi:hypothetical protein
MPDYIVFVVPAEIRTLPPAPGKETVHFILIQIYQAAVAFIFLIINIIHAYITITVCHFDNFLFCIFPQSCCDTRLLSPESLGSKYAALPYFCLS